MPVNKRKTASKLKKTKISRKKPARKAIKAAARKPARKFAKRVAIQRGKEPVTSAERPVEILEVVETEIYEEPVFVSNEDELS